MKKRSFTKLAVCAIAALVIALGVVPGLSFAAEPASNKTITGTNIKFDVGETSWTYDGETGLPTISNVYYYDWEEIPSEWEAVTNTEPIEDEAYYYSVSGYAVDAGSHTAIVTIYKNKNAGFEWTKEASCEVHFEIAKAPATVLTKPTPLIQIYSGSPQPLIDPGVGGHGTMVYSLDNENFSTDIPYGLEDIYYKVYYYVVADENYYDTEVDYVIAQIGVNSTSDDPTPEVTDSADDDSDGGSATTDEGTGTTSKTTSGQVAKTADEAPVVPLAVGAAFAAALAAGVALNRRRSNED